MVVVVSVGGGGCRFGVCAYWKPVLAAPPDSRLHCLPAGETASVSASGCVCLPFFFCGLGVGGATQLLPGSINLEMGRLLYRVARYCYTSISCVVRGRAILSLS
jgi:hypothetical protein